MFLSRRKNSKIWYVFWWEGGRRKKVSTGTTKRSGALQFLRTFTPKSGGEEPPPPRAILELFLHEQSHLYTPKTIEHFRVAVREWCRIAGDNVAEDEVGRFLKQKQEEASPWTARKYHIALRSMYNWALRRSLVKTNPFNKISQVKVRETTPRYFTKEMLLSLVVCCESMQEYQMAAIILVLAYTGLRIGEMLSLQPSDIQGRLLVVRGEHSKSKRTRSVPIHPIVMRILDEHPELFGSYKLNTLEKKFKAAVRECGLDHRLRLHDLRHTFASWLVQRGVSLYKVSVLLGHKDLRTTQIYAHLDHSSLEQEVYSL